MSLSAAVDEIGVALESTLLAEREIASGRLVRPLQGKSEDVFYTGHWLVFPRSGRYARSMVTFITWLTRELGLDIDMATLDDMAAPPLSPPLKSIR
jgi:DNA-binding transcriptional LysR family regulator